MGNIIKGKGVVENIGVGKLFIIKDNIDEYLKDYSKKSIDEEKKIFESSLDNVKKALEEIVGKFDQDGKKEQSEIMGAHLAIVNDPELLRQSMELINNGYEAPKSVLEASKNIAMIFENLDDAYLRERAADVKDVGKRIAKEILGIKDDFNNLEDEIILYGDEIEPSILANIPEDKVKGMVLGTGSTTSHTVIIAKSKEIPTIVGIKENDNFKENELVIIDGYEGTIIIDPDEDTKIKYKNKIEEEEKKRE
jgi:phosphotransferase system enzyme I (PtsI)